jgi:hypothetical protein
MLIFLGELFDAEVAMAICSCFYWHMQLIYHWSSLSTNSGIKPFAGDYGDQKYHER